MVLKVEKRFSESRLNIEEGQKTYTKRQSQFRSFDVVYKKEKRVRRLQKIQAQSDKVAELVQLLSSQIQEKLTLNLSEENKESLNKYVEQLENRVVRVEERDRKAAELKDQLSKIEIPSDFRETEPQARIDVNVQEMLVKLKSVKEGLESYALRVQNDNDVLVTVQNRVREMKLQE